MSTTGLIDALQDVDKPTFGLHGTAFIIGFAGDDSQPEFGGGVFGSPRPARFGQIRELVRRGPTALPELLKHVDDARPTKLVFGGDGFRYMFSYYAEEYDPRDQRLGRLTLGPGAGEAVPLPYTVKVGDVCYSLIGAIADRNLMAIRYQATAGLIVNSPVKSATLAKRVRSDWTGVDAAALKASLIADVKSSNEGWAGLPQLRLYFPEVYEGLRTGPMKTRVEMFESRFRTSNQLPDPTSPSVTPAAGAAGAPSVAADH
jgi:hypothetical protein